MERAVEKELQNTLKVFAPISLTQLNASVSFLERIDTKYLVHVKDLAKIVKELEKDYYVLNIKDLRMFNYDNVYMDSKDLAFYYAHERGDAIRVKVRTRNYTDSNLCFFEYKHKEGKMIRKFRYQEDPSLHGGMDEEANFFFHSVYGSLMEGAPSLEIAPTMKTTYKRFTLCSRFNDERLTIDLDLSFEDPNNTNGPRIELPHLAIIESKAGTAESRSAKLMKKFDVKKASGCSKYCLGLIYLKKVASQTKFKETLARIEKLGGNVSIKRTEAKVAKAVKSIKKSAATLQREVRASINTIDTKKTVVSPKQSQKRLAGAAKK
jgi:VTC domain